MARNNTFAEPIEGTNPLDILMASEGEAVEAAEARASQAQDEASRLYNDFIAARDRGQAATRALLQGSQPRYDVKRAERLRKAAIVQSFGDMATALARGATAYGPRGAGYVPRTNLNSPLASIEEINRMREVYRQNKKAWDAQMLNFDLANERAKVQAAEALYSTAQERAKAERERAEDAAQQYRDRMAEAAMLGVRLTQDAEENEKNRQNALRLAAMRVGSVNNGGASRAGREPSEADQDRLVAQIYLRLHPDSQNSSTSTRAGGLPGQEITTTTTGSHTWASAAVAGYRDEETRAVLALVAEGYELEAVIQAVEALR